MVLDSSQAYDRLRRKIFFGDLLPGTKLVERDLAEQLNVSRMPVRIALSQMVAQGMLVVGQKQRSVSVREYSPSEIAQLYEFREVLECSAVRAACERAGADDLAHLGRICDDMQSKVGSRRSLPAWAELDHAFHEAIAAASANEWFCSVNKLLLQQTHFVLFRVRGHLWSQLDDTLLTRRMQGVVDVHGRIVTFIRNGNTNAAEQAMRDHVRMSFKFGTSAAITPSPGVTPSSGENS